MRLFVCLRPPVQARDDLAGALVGVRTTRVEQWHVTLAFLGEVADVDALVPGLAAASSASRPLRLQLAGSGFFRRPGILYARVAGDVDALQDLAAGVAAACRSAGVDLEDRPFRPHLTVARRLPADPGALGGYQGPPWTATRLELVRSRMGASVEHVVLERWPLGG